MAVTTKDEKIWLLGQAPVHKALLRLVGPTILSQLVSMIYNFADAFFVGQLGDPHQIAALSLVFPLYMMTTMLGNLFGIGGNSVIARALGEQNFRKVQRTSAFSLYSCAAVSLLFALILAPSLKAILYFIGASENTIGYAHEYLTIVLVWGVVPTSLQLTLSHLIRSEGASRQAGFGIMLGGILNILLDPIFMFVLGLGFKGAALATLLSNIVSLLYFVAIRIRTHSGSFLSYNIRDYRLRSGKDVLSNGAAAAILIVFGSTANIVMTRTASGFSDLAVASFGILQKFTTMAVFIAVGIGQGTAPLLGFNYTARNLKRIQAASRMAIIADIAISAVFLILLEFFPLFFTSLFSADQETAQAAAHFVRIGCLGISGTLLMNFFTAAFQAYGRWKSNFVMNFVRQLLIYVPNILIMSRLWGVNGLAFSYPISEILSAIMALVIYLRMMGKIAKELRAQQ